jgi:hypothetical protein
MSYYIKGRHKHSTVVDVYVRNLIKHLKLHRLTKTSLTIEFVELLDEGATFGQCEAEKTEALVMIARSTSKGKLSFLEQMFSLSHEMVHVKQYFRGELTNGKDGEWKWKNRNAYGYKYQNQPWEKEASRLETELFLKCFPFEMM